MLPLTQAHTVVAIARPFAILAPVVLANAILFPLGQGIVVGVVVVISIRARSPEHLINFGLRGPTSSYRVLWMLLDTARHGGVARPAIHRCRLRQDYGTARRVGVVHRSTRVGVIRPTSRATGHEDPPKQGQTHEHSGRQVCHAASVDQSHFETRRRARSQGLAGRAPYLPG